MVNLELLNKSLTQREDWPTFRAISLHKGFITWLFKNYTTIEYCKYFYTSMPEIPEKWRFKRFGPEAINIWENEEFLIEEKKLRNDYEPTRLSICDWQEYYYEGCWGDLTQQKVDEVAYSAMLECRNRSINKKNRFWIGHMDKDTIICYWYGRDLNGKWMYENYNDKCWIMKRK